MKTKICFPMIVMVVVLLSGIVFSQTTVTYEDFPKARMMLIGIPLNFDDDDPGSVLTPVFGEQIRNDDVYWRFSRWNVANQTYFRYGEEEYTWDHDAQAYTAEKTEQGNPHDIEPGYGYWLAQSSANVVDDLSLTGTPVDQEASVYVTVDPPQTVQGHDYPGITMVSNPFLYTIDWANAKYRINGNSEVTLEQAVNMGLVSQYAYPWDGDQYTPLNMTDGGNLAVWDGYWVEQLNPTETEYVVYDVACEFEGGGGGGDDCGSCPDEEYGMLDWLQLRYDGPQAASIQVFDNHWQWLYWGEVESGGIFDFYGHWNQSGGLGPKIHLYVYYNESSLSRKVNNPLFQSSEAGGSDIFENESKIPGTGPLSVECHCPDDYVEIHTSCSVAIGVGQVWGPVTIMAGANKDGIPLCPIGETIRPIVKFYDADADGLPADLGDGGVIETDRFTVSLNDDDNDELYFNTFTISGDSSDWIALTNAGVPVSDGQGYTVTLVSEDGDDYVVDVASTGSQSEAMEAVKFRFGDDQIIDVPVCGETFTSTRSLLNGVQISTLELMTPAIETEGSLAKASLKPSHPLKAESVSEWIIPISVVSGDGELKDTYNGFGVKEAASAMFDLMDARNFTPNLNNWVDLYFPHHEQGNPITYWPQQPMKVAYDVRPEAEQISWDLDMAYYNAGNQQFIISWDASQFPAEADMELVLVDFDNSTRTDMLAESDYTVTTPEEEYGTLYFAIVVYKQEGSGIKNSDIVTPADFKLSANYPNPFNASTRISYSLPAEAEVKLNIYSLNGNLVKSLVNKRQASGYYGFDWDGTDYAGNQVASGIYIYSLEADHRVESRKMILMK